MLHLCNVFKITMQLVNFLPKLIEHKVPVSILNIHRRVFFHWKKEGIIDYEPYIIEKENENDEESKPVKKWLHLNAFDMLWLLMVKELRNFNVDLKTIKELKIYLDKSVYNIKILGTIMVSKYVDNNVLNFGIMVPKYAHVYYFNI